MDEVLKDIGPPHLELRYLLLKYFNAWRTQSTELIEQLFDQNASYKEKAFDPPIQGLEQIKQYWRDNVIPQRHLDVGVLDVVYSDNEVFAEWQANFTDKHGCLRRVSGILVLSPTSDLTRIALLREYFRTDADIK